MPGDEGGDTTRDDESAERLDADAPEVAGTAGGSSPASERRDDPVKDEPDDTPPEGDTSTRELGLPERWAEVGAFIQQQRNSARLSVRKLSALAGISNPYLSQIERGLRQPSAHILQQIAKALRISAETLYIRAGILEPRTEDDGLVRHILAEPNLLEDQRQMLIRLYLMFLHENGVVTEEQP